MFDLKDVGDTFSPDAAADAAQSPSLPWILARSGLPYFVTEDGEPWTPIGQNDAISWPELSGLFCRRDLPGVERHLRWLKASGVTCLRLMLEYAQGQHRYIEKPVGCFAPNMVRLWDDLFALCEKVGLHILLTPFDTFFTWVRWKHHPYNSRNGGPCSGRQRLLSCPATREAVKARLEFATRRWGGSPALFAWDLWNEAHPAHAEGDVGAIVRFIDEVGPWLRQLEARLHGRAHLQTVSVFGPELLKTPELAEPIFRHPALDFANTHLYATGTIDDPRNTVAPALATGRLIRAAINETRDMRPVFDSEHGPIHSFKDRHRTLAENFDNEYFRHMQWAHLASGGAGGGMRWPNRHPHVLTPGMRTAQASLSRFLPLIEWTRFRRRNLNEEIGLSERGVAAFACGDDRQAIVWLLRTNSLDVRGKITPKAKSVQVSVPGLDRGCFRIVIFDTITGRLVGERQIEHRNLGGELELEVVLSADVALALRRLA